VKDHEFDYRSCKGDCDFRIGV